MVALVMIFLRTSSFGFCVAAWSGDSCDSASRIWLSSASILLAMPAPSLRPSMYCASSSASSGNDPSINNVEVVILTVLRGREQVWYWPSNFGHASSCGRHSDALSSPMNLSALAKHAWQCQLRHQGSIMTWQAGYRKKSRPQNNC